MTLEVGNYAPDFVLMDEDGIPRQLSAYKGKPIVLYFYPRDDTPGCTTEACGFRDDYSAYLDAGVVILGISPNPPESHKKFKEKFNLPFNLLADTDRRVCELYGVWGLKKLMGKTYYGVLRTTFLIDPERKILKIYHDVNPAGHSEEVLADLRKS